MKGGSATKDAMIRERRTEGWRDCQCRYDRPHGNDARLKRRRARRNLKQKLKGE